MRSKASVLTANITSSGGVHSLYIDGRIDGKNKSSLIDTGAIRTIARPEIEKAHSRLSPASVQLRTATGEIIKTYGEVNITVCIGKTTIKHKILVAEISDQFILGMDLLNILGAALDVKNGVLKVDDEDSPSTKTKQILSAKLLVT